MPAHSIDDLRELEDPEAAARAVGLRYVGDDEPGITRRRRGKGFSYYGPDGGRVDDPGERERLDAIAVPPAWTDVWLCPDPRGHIQATGRDARGRKQYRYHPDWRAARDGAKYARMVSFGRALPEIRRVTAGHLRRKGQPREKVLAVVVRLLEETLIRIGNAEYARDNESFGLTTLRDRHVGVRGGRIRFDFRAKGGKRRRVQLNDARLAAVVKECRDIPGYELFQYYDDEDERRTVNSGDVNEYLRDLTGEEFTSKDFRTWAATMHAATELLACGPGGDEREANARLKAAIETVAERLGNTPAVCRACYIHPLVIERYLDGSLEEALALAARGSPRGLSRLEASLLKLLEKSAAVPQTS